MGQNCLYLRPNSHFTNFSFFRKLKSVRVAYVRGRWISEDSRHVSSENFFLRKKIKRSPSFIFSHDLICCKFCLIEPIRCHIFEKPFFKKWSKSGSPWDFEDQSKADSIFAHLFLESKILQQEKNNTEGSCRAFFKQIWARREPSGRLKLSNHIAWWENTTLYRKL